MSHVDKAPVADGTVTARPETDINARPEPRNGVAPIKAEYLINPKPVVENASTEELNHAAPYSTADDDAEGSSARKPDARDARDARDGRDNKRRKMDKMEKTGQNKARHFPVLQESGVKICRSWETTGTCSKGPACRFQHDWAQYFQLKPFDIHYELNPTILTTPADGSANGGYVVLGSPEVGGEDYVGKTIDVKTSCPVYEDLGYCPYGWRCRFLGGHSTRVAEGAEKVQPAEGAWQLKGSQIGRQAPTGRWKVKETNFPNTQLLQSLKFSEYPFPFSDRYLKHAEPQKEFTLGKKPPKKSKVVSEEDAINGEEAALNVSTATEIKGVVDGQAESLDVPLRPEEKRSLNWENGLYLAPLTTNGNLPFRRLCVSYGATITCSEMALAQPLVTGHNDEWALVRRHESEKMFGVQLAGGFPNRMVPAAELLSREVGDGVDFVDVNMGCPIDLVFNQGAGSALLESPGRLGKILVGMNRALGEIPLTVKFRTGVASTKPNAHKLIPRFATEWGASAMTLHGRSRQQRYSKNADWAYIKQCCDGLREAVSDAGMPKIPMFGNGDCFSAQSYYEEKEASGVDGVMVARGALIKPWLFTEIAERREWDISATERLEGIRKFAEFGLSHWGSDTQGVSTTRRFLCEALSFQHRYIPIGLLERLPAKMNDRPPAFRGRSELETLLSSPFAGDWVKISEMFLGKSDDRFNFIPKHKSNAYGAEEAQG